MMTLLNYFKIIFILLLIYGISGCFSKTSNHFELNTLNSNRLPLPTTNEVMLVDGVAFTLSAFITLRQQLPSVSQDEILWHAAALLLLNKEAKRIGRDLSPISAFELTRYAKGEYPQELASSSLMIYYPNLKTLPSAIQMEEEIDRLIRLAVIQRNNPLLNALQ